MTQTSPLPAPRPPRVLLVGAGAVGQVFGYHLQRTGAAVSFLVKPKHARACRQGFPLWELAIGRAPRGPLRFDGFEVLTQDAEVAARHFDQVWLCISSTALRGAWFERLSRAIGDATLVCLQPDPQARDYVTAHVPARQLVQGMIGFVAYQAPLPGSSLIPEPGLAYWLPPGFPTPLGGATQAFRLAEAIGLLRQGGLPCEAEPEIDRQAAFPTAGLMPFLVALELEGWSLRATRRGAWLEAASAATREACQIMARRHQVRPPGPIMRQRPWMLRALLGIAPLACPFPLQTYLEYHFTKVGDQTRQTLRMWRQLGEEFGVPRPHLARMAEALAHHDRRQ